VFLKGHVRTMLVIDRIVKKDGNSAKVSVPKDLIGKLIVILDEDAVERLLGKKE